MENSVPKIENRDWEGITETMHRTGHALIPGLLSERQCETLKAGYGNADLYRKTVVMAKHGFGSGEYKYFDYPLPEIVQQARTRLYPLLAPIANAWFKALGIGTSFPGEHAEFLQRCHQAGQQKATALILKYGPGGFNTLHQDLYGDVFFPMQLVIMLDRPGVDFTGGELVLTQQVPRAQSKAMVLIPQKGDAVVFTTNFKPQKGTKGYYRSNMKHGVSEVKTGERHTLGIIFHDAAS